jgi:hypothetical protein
VGDEVQPTIAVVAITIADGRRYLGARLVGAQYSDTWRLRGGNCAAWKDVRPPITACRTDPITIGRAAAPTGPKPAGGSNRW